MIRVGAALVRTITSCRKQRIAYRHRFQKEEIPNVVVKDPVRTSAPNIWSNLEK